MTIHGAGTWGKVSQHEPVLWGLVVVSMVVDTALTYYGLERGLVEGNPVARFGLERFGYVTLGALKILALGVGLVGRTVLPADYTPIVPLGLAIPWTIASLINAVLIVTVS